MRRCFHFE